MRAGPAGMAVLEHDVRKSVGRPLGLIDYSATQRQQLGGLIDDPVAYRQQLGSLFFGRHNTSTA